MAGLTAAGFFLPDSPQVAPSLEASTRKLSKGSEPKERITKEGNSPLNEKIVDGITLESSLVSPNFIFEKALNFQTRLETGKKVHIPIILNKERWREVPEWQEIGPQIEVLPGENKDGIRAANGSSDGRFICVGTWYHGSWYRDEGGKWLKFSEKTPSVGINRQILVIEPGREISPGWQNIRALTVCDSGLEVIKHDSSRYNLEAIGFPEGFPLGFAQTGSFLPNGELLIGGMSGLVKIKNWNEKQFRGETLLSGTNPQTGENLMIRSIAVSSQDPKLVFAGGWWGYSGQTKDGQGKILPGAGVWKNEESGKPGSWRNVLKNINVNCLFVHPENSNIVIAGTEGAGNQSTRNPDSSYPSLFISLDRGESWNTLTPNPWLYDLVTPQQAFFFDQGEKILYISFWGGPTQAVFLPPSLTKERLNFLNWKFLGDPDSKNDFRSGHIMGVNDGSRLNIVTGSFQYWVRPISSIPSFTPLYRWQVNKGPVLH